MVHIGFDIEEGVLAPMKLEPREFARELMIAAAVKMVRSASGQPRARC